MFANGECSVGARGQTKCGGHCQICPEKTLGMFQHQDITPYREDVSIFNADNIHRVTRLRLLAGSYSLSSWPWAFNTWLGSLRLSLDFCLADHGAERPSSPAGMGRRGVPTTAAPYRVLSSASVQLFVDGIPDHQQNGARRIPFFRVRVDGLEHGDELLGYADDYSIFLEGRNLGGYRASQFLERKPGLLAHRQKLEIRWPPSPTGRRATHITLAPRPMPDNTLSNGERDSS
jgi:hypothetical protein